MDRRTFTKGAIAAPALATCAAPTKAEPKDLIDQVREAADEMAERIGADRWQMQVGSDFGHVMFSRVEGNISQIIAEARF